MSKQELSKQTISIIKGAICKILKVVPGKAYCIVIYCFKSHRNSYTV